MPKCFFRYLGLIFLMILFLNFMYYMSLMPRTTQKSTNDELFSYLVRQKYQFSFFIHFFVN